MPYANRHQLEHGARFATQRTFVPNRSLPGARPASFLTTGEQGALSRRAVERVEKDITSTPNDRSKTPHHTNSTHSSKAPLTHTHTHTHTYTHTGPSEESHLRHSHRRVPTIQKAFVRFLLAKSDVLSLVNRLVSADDADEEHTRTHTYTQTCPAIMYSLAKVG